MNFLKIFIFSALLGSLCACDKATTTTPQPAPFADCLGHLKGGSFEIYRMDTQSFNAHTDQAAGTRGSRSIDTNQSSYMVYEFNADATSVTKKSKSFTYPTRSFRIEGDKLYFGDDAVTLQECDVNGFSIQEIDELGAPDYYLKVQALYRKRN